MPALHCGAQAPLRHSCWAVRTTFSHQMLRRWRGRQSAILARAVHAAKAGTTDRTTRAKPAAKDAIASTARSVSQSSLQNAAKAMKDAPRVVLKRGKTAVFRNGHPMVYSGAVDRVIGKPQPQAGDCVLVTDSTEVPIGWGVFNPASWFRVRIMQLEHEINKQGDVSCIFNMQQLITNRLQTAVQLRKTLGLGILPSAEAQAHAAAAAADDIDTERSPSSGLASAAGSNGSGNGAATAKQTMPTAVQGIDTSASTAQQETTAQPVSSTLDQDTGKTASMGDQQATVASSLQAITDGSDAFEAASAERRMSNCQASTSSSNGSNNSSIDISGSSSNSSGGSSSGSGSGSGSSIDSDSSNGSGVSSSSSNSISNSNGSGSNNSSGGSSSSGTNVYRLVNSEGDRLSGLNVDVFGGQAVIASSAAWTERHKDTITQELQKVCSLTSAPIWKQSKEMLQEEGITIQPQEEAAEEAAVQVVENGIKLWVSLSSGQKTGFYADQRDSRLTIRQLSQGRAVLDLCCYTGGFALNALAGGATHVTGVDSSASALALAQQSAQLNGWQPSQYTFLKNDIHKYMQQQIAEGRQWDLVVLDPPKLAPNKKGLMRALNKYRKLNQLAMQVLKPGGLLMTCSCSGTVTLNEYFLPVLKEAAGAAGRHISILRTAGAGPDHPIDSGYPEGLYLKNVLLLVT